jgi:hypothetical protein
MSSDEQSGRRFPVQADPAPALSAESRTDLEREEADLIERVLLGVPDERREHLRGILSDRSRRIAATSDPALVGTLNQLSAVRAAIQALDAKEATEADVARTGGQPRMRVTVALAPAMRDSLTRAVVLRRPGDGGIPILLLSENSVTALDVERGLNAAVMAAQQYDRELTKAFKLVLRARAKVPGARESDAGAKLLQRLSTAPVRQIPGVGTVRAIDVMARATRAATSGG